MVEVCVLIVEVARRSMMWRGTAWCGEWCCVGLKGPSFLDALSLSCGKDGHVPHVLLM